MESMINWIENHTRI